MFSKSWDFLLDQNVPEPFARLLTENGQNAIWSRDVLGAEAKDPVLARYAIAHARILVTWDRDFAHQRFMSPRFKGLWRIGISVPEPLAVERFSDVADVVEFWLMRSKTPPPEIKVAADKVMGRDKLRA